MDGRVKISPGNSKMGAIPSVSLPAVVTCRDCDCKKKCYALRIEKRRKNVAKAYQNNLDILRDDPETYWREVEAHVMMSRFFRFHVSGDIPDAQYLHKIVSVAQRNQHCEILCFTKKYELVNRFLLTGGSLPRNLHLIFSAWPGTAFSNPFLLPTAHVRFRDGTTTAAGWAKECAGNCTECAVTEGGCWALQKGEQVVFNEH